MAKRVVIALGGNAILRPNQEATFDNQMHNIKMSAELIAKIEKLDYEIVVTHGNGPQVGNILRQNEEAKAIVPSAKKVGGPGTRLDVPVTHVNASYVRSHFDAMEVGIPDAPRADELMLALVMTTGSRIHARVGGLKADQIKGEDGLR